MLALAVCFVGTLRKIESLGPAGQMWVLFGVTVALRATTACIRHGASQMGAELTVYPGEETLYDILKIQQLGVVRFLDKYAEVMPSLSVHGRNYPPGYALIQYGITQIFGAHIAFTGWTLVVFSSSVVFPIMLAADKLMGSAGRFAAGTLVASFPASVIYGAVSMSSLFAALASWAIYFLVAGLTRPDGSRHFFVAGLTLGISMSLSFATLLLGFMLFLAMVAIVPASAFFAREARTHTLMPNLQFTAALLLLQTGLYESLLYTLW